MTFCEDSDDPYRVTTAVYQFVQGDYLWAQHMTALEIRLVNLAHIGTLNYRGIRASAADLNGMSWLGIGETVQTVPNPWGIVPVYSFVNGNGASDLFPMLNAQDSLNKAIFNLESSAEFHGFPLLEVRGYNGRHDENGAPLDLTVGAGSYILVDEKGGVKRVEAGELTQLLAAESRGYLRVAQQGRSPAVLMEFKGLGDSGRVPGFLLEPLKMRMNSKLSGAKHALELLARDLPRYGLRGAIPLEEYQLDVEIKLPLPSDKIGEAEGRAREVDVGAMTRQQAARLRGEDPKQFLTEWQEELEILEGVKADGQIKVEASKPKPKPVASRAR